MDWIETLKYCEMLYNIRLTKELLRKQRKFTLHYKKLKIVTNYKMVTNTISRNFSSLNKIPKIH